ncbi:MAG: SpoIIIAH-like family protein [Clostridiales bacterium]|nr:SpoIIIAH-like family protein [Clostridiales bacterium]
MKVKNIFKKNQVIIFALALMIAIAGYLNFSRDKAGEKQAEEAASSAVGDELFTQVDGESFTDISDEDDALLSEDMQQGNMLVVNDPVTTDGELVSKEDSAGEEVATDPETGLEVAETGTEKATKAPEVGEDVAKTENAAPGEAILASTQINSSYFSTAKLTREQTRARNKESLMGIIQDASVAQEQKDAAIDTLVALTAIAEKENSTEILLEAKGFSGVVVSIVEDSVDVIVNSTSLTEQDMAIIEDVVMRKTGAEAKNIVITNVVTEE